MVGATVSPGPPPLGGITMGASTVALTETASSEIIKISIFESSPKVPDIVTLAVCAEEGFTI